MSWFLQLISFLHNLNIYNTCNNRRKNSEEDGVTDDSHCYYLLIRYILWLEGVTTRTPTGVEYGIAICHGPLTRYTKVRVVHAPGMPGTFYLPPRVSDPDMHHGTCVTLVPWCMPGSLTSGSLWSQWRRKRSRHSRHMRNPQFRVSGKRPIV